MSASLLVGMTACTSTKGVDAEPMPTLDERGTGGVQSSGTDQDVDAMLHSSGLAKSWDEQVEEASNRVEKIVDERDRLMEPLKKPTD